MEEIKSAVNRRKDISEVNDEKSKDSEDEDDNEDENLRCKKCKKQCKKNGKDEGKPARLLSATTKNSGGKILHVFINCVSAFFKAIALACESIFV